MYLISSDYQLQRLLQLLMKIKKYVDKNKERSCVCVCVYIMFVLCIK